jgi:hypothetical protein
LLELEINSLKEPAMNRKAFGAIVASTLLGWAGVSFAQTSSYGSGESARCNTMTGEQKEQCLRDEANKTQGAPADAASSGATSREAATPGEKYEKNAGSPHCDQMTGAEKEKCLDAEARKDQNPAPSKTD